ncbi:MAG: hypothetical protein QM757_23300 [Paludibaculum sp.]
MEIDTKKRFSEYFSILPGRYSSRRRGSKENEQVDRQPARRNQRKGRALCPAFLCLQVTVN